MTIETYERRLLQTRSERDQEKGFAGYALKHLAQHVSLEEQEQQIRQLATLDYTTLSETQGYDEAHEWLWLYTSSWAFSALSEESEAIITDGLIELDLPDSELVRVMLGWLGSRRVNPYSASVNDLTDYLFKWLPNTIDYDPVFFQAELIELRALFHFFADLGAPNANECLRLLNTKIFMAVHSISELHDQRVRLGFRPTRPELRGYGASDAGRLKGPFERSALTVH